MCDACDSRNHVLFELLHGCKEGISNSYHVVSLYLTPFVELEINTALKCRWINFTKFVDHALGHL